ncbi:hypothetical protein U1Q18_051725 [Sarracenia purpurea var. burkii]
MRLEDDTCFARCAAPMRHSTTSAKPKLHSAYAMQVQYIVPTCDAIKMHRGVWERVLDENIRSRTANTVDGSRRKYHRHRREQTFP